jgi:GNAT superfamily N-acetyltransferase
MDEPAFSLPEFIDVLVRSTLAERRPVDQQERIGKRLANADLIVTARAGGLSRAISDFAFCTAVDQTYQGRGIGRELLQRTHESARLHTSWFCWRPRRPRRTTRTLA